MSSDEEFIQSYKLAGILVGKKNGLTAGAIPMVSSDQEGQLEDSGITEADLTAIVGATPEPAIADVTGTADATYSANEQTLINSLKTQLNAVLAALRAKDIIDP